MNKKGPFAMLWTGGGLLRKHLAAIVLAGLAGVMASGATVVLLTKINLALHQPFASTIDASRQFLILALVILTGRAASNAITNRVGESSMRELRLLLARRILAAPLDALERFKLDRLTPVLHQDVGVVGGLCLMLPITAVAAAAIVGCFGWLFWMSWQLTALTLCVLVIAFLVLRIARDRAERNFSEARNIQDALQKSWTTLAFGARELRLNRRRRRALFDADIAQHVRAIGNANIRAGDAFSIGYETGSAMYFLLIALAFTAAWWWRLPTEVTSGFVLALLYMKGPVDQVLGFLPYLVRTKVSLARIAELSEQLATPEKTALAGPHSLAFRDAITLTGACYRFQDCEGVPGFSLGPVDLTINRGEILFIVGDNGAGKSTLIKLIMGLYVPPSGRVLLDGTEVTDATRDEYRQLFSPVLSDFHLFDELPPTDDTELERESKARAVMKMLALDGKLEIRDGRLSTTDLSTGQRKRLALLHAWVEARPVMVFDEWAADQDPGFRRRFYTEFLPALRESGHTLIVISHDDRYFSVADRVFTLTNGAFTTTTTSAKSSAWPAS